MKEGIIPESFIAEQLIDKPNNKGQYLYADSAYAGTPIEELRRDKEMHNKVCE